MGSNIAPPVAHRLPREQRVKKNNYLMKKGQENLPLFVSSLSRPYRQTRETLAKVTHVTHIIP